MFNPHIRGWINYYSHFYKSAMYPTLRRIDVFLTRWARRKFKRLRQRPKGARDWLAGCVASLAVLAGSLKDREYHNPTGNLQVAADGARADSLCGALVSSLLAEFRDLKPATA
ncbi:MAG: group II intron maturase-specific domain-containing protein [Candidatus Binataceae bacterium]|jgi:hypothetical protein